MISPAPEIFVPVITYVPIYFFNFNEGRPELQTPTTAQELVDQFQPFWDELGRYAFLKRLEVNWVDYGAKPGLERPIFTTLADKLLRTVHMATNGRLDQLFWKIPWALHLAQPIPKTFESSLDLQELQVHAHYNGGHPEGYGPDQLKLSLLGDVVLHNPNIRSIILQGASPYTFCTWEELFPPQLDKLAIEKIRIEGYLSRTPSFPSSSISAFTKLPHLKELAMYTGRLHHTSETNLDPLWMLLKNSDARLTRLELQYGLSDVLADYLASYSGLSHLECNVYRPPTSLSDTFLSRILPHHATSLTMLRLSLSQDFNIGNSGREGIAINPSTWPAPSAFRRLRLLDIATPPKWDLTVERARHLLGYITEMPKLRLFEAQWLQPNPFLHATGEHSNQHYPINSQEFDRRISSIGENVAVKRCSLVSLEFTMECGMQLGDKRIAAWRIEFPVVMGDTAESASARALASDEDFLLKDFEHSCKWDDSHIICSYPG
ncbi:hypothetical protein AX16_010558 [Volvariella volvacea WC 439]|nr:hypothetical protein AX16_010558 [Volvariella volvacea WC 439]